MSKPVKVTWSAPAIAPIELTEEILALFRSAERTEAELAGLDALARQLRRTAA